MRFLLACLAALLLAGCYESNGLLLNASQSRQPITTYQDWNYGSGDHRYHARLNPRSDGWYDYEEAKIKDDGTEDAWKHHTVLLNYLQNTNGQDVYVFGTWDDGEKAYFYGVVVVGTNGAWQSITPNCDPVNSSEKWYVPDVNAAKQAGAEIKTIDDMEDVCMFTSVGALFNAMRNVVATPGFWDRVEEAKT
jgi:hypothetical protein